MTRMNILITGGSTFIPIDKVRGITNIFKGRTACEITAEALNRENKVTLLGNPGMDQGVHNKPIGGEIRGPSFLPYKTYNGLFSLMEKKITTSGLDIIIHSAAVSDYKVIEYGEDLDGWSGQYLTSYFQPIDKGKIRSGCKNLFLRLTPTEKIIDKIRTDWGFKGNLVKFKLQVDMPDRELIKIAKESRKHSQADVIVANCLEWARERAYIITEMDTLEVSRKDLPNKLLDVLGV